MNNLPKVVAQQRRGRGSNPRLLDRKSDALPLSHRATTKPAMYDNTLKMPVLFTASTLQATQPAHLRASNSLYRGKHVVSTEPVRFIQKLHRFSAMDTQ